MGRFFNFLLSIIILGKTYCQKKVFIYPLAFPINKDNLHSVGVIARLLLVDLIGPLYAAYLLL